MKSFYNDVRKDFNDVMDQEKTYISSQWSLPLIEGRDEYNFPKIRKEFQEEQLMRQEIWQAEKSYYTMS